MHILKLLNVFKGEMFSENIYIIFKQYKSSFQCEILQFLSFYHQSAQSKNKIAGKDLTTMA